MSSKPSGRAPPATSVLFSNGKTFQSPYAFMVRRTWINHYLSRTDDTELGQMACIGELFTVMAKQYETGILHLLIDLIQGCCQKAGYLPEGEP